MIKGLKRLNGLSKEEEKRKGRKYGLSKGEQGEGLALS